MDAAFKKKIIAKMLENLEAEMNVMITAALVAREAATHEESKAEDKYDTRGLEASYLAGAQAKRAAELQRLIHTYQALEVKDFQKNTPIATTAVVEVEVRSKKTFLFLVPKGGGMNVSVDGKSIQIVTPDSRLGGELIGKKVGDYFELQIANGTSEYEVLDVF